LESVAIYFEITITANDYWRYGCSLMRAALALFILFFLHKLDKLLKTSEFPALSFFWQILAENRTRKISETHTNWLISGRQKQHLPMQQKRSLPSHERPLWVGGHVQLNVLLPFLQVPPFKHGELVHSS